MNNCRHCQNPLGDNYVGTEHGLFCSWGCAGNHKWSFERRAESSAYALLTVSLLAFVAEVVFVCL